MCLVEGVNKDEMGWSRFVDGMIHMLYLVVMNGMIMFLVWLEGFEVDAIKCV